MSHDFRIEAALMRKVNRRIVPLMACAWFIAYLDRFNVSFAALQMNRQVGLSSAAYGLGAGLFFLGYGLLEIPSNYVLCRIGARITLARIMITWGIAAAGMAFVQGPTSFYALRFLLGAAEAGAFPGIAFYVSQWVEPRARASVFALITATGMAALVVGGPLAAWLLSFNALGLAGWQWLFLVEGVPAVAVGVAVWLWLPESPQSASWLTADERGVLAARAHDTASRVSLSDILNLVFRNPHYWGWGAAFFCASAAGAASNLFRPTILRTMTGLDETLVALLTAVPGLVGVIAVTYVGRRATALNERRWHAAMPLLVAAVGIASAGLVTGWVLALTVAALSSIGAAAQPPLFASVSAEDSGATRAIAIAFVNSVSAIGGFLGPYLMGWLLDTTGSLVVPCAVAGGVLVVGASVIALTRDRVEAVRPKGAVLVS